MVYNEVIKLMDKIEKGWDNRNTCDAMEYSRICKRGDAKNWYKGKIFHLKLGTVPAQVILYNEPVIGEYVVGMDDKKHTLLRYYVDDINLNTIFISYI